MSTDDKHSDLELKAWLDGSDGVSAAYRQVAREEPPAALDRLILDAARKQVQPAPESRASLLRPYALAASVMLGVIALSLYINSPELAVPPTVMQEQVVTAPEAPRRETVVAEADAASAAEKQEQDAAAVQAPAGETFVTRALPAPVPAVGAAGNAVATPPAPAVAVDAFARAAEPPTVVIDGPRLQNLEAELEAAREQANVAATAAREEGELEEIQVTGSRILRRDAGDLSYRDSRGAWLEELRFMAEELRARSRLITARQSAAVLQTQLEEEMDLFLVAYPDTDLEAELEE